MKRAEHRLAMAEGRLPKPDNTEPEEGLVIEPDEPVDELPDEKDDEEEN